MVFMLSAFLLANATSVVNSSTIIEGEGSTHTFIQTSVNGNTTTVESNEPGSIRVEKTDTTENITSDKPVTVTHDTPSPMSTPEASVSAEEKIFPASTQSNWVSLLRTLWDRVKSFLSFGLLTRK